jgi:hypothetical protein
MSVPTGVPKVGHGKVGIIRVLIDARLSRECPTFCEGISEKESHVYEDAEQERIGRGPRSGVAPAVSAASPWSTERLYFRLSVVTPLQMTTTWAPISPTGSCTTT